jgi:predicted AlkP superfamily pyrophosphatase or phosphodiesterase
MPSTRWRHTPDDFCRRTIPVLLLAIFLTAHAPFAQGTAGTAPARDRHVVIVSLDGFPASLLEDARLPIPTLRRLMREGASAARLHVVNPAVTWPNHTSMVTGVRPAGHQVLYNGLLVRPEGQSPHVEPWRDKKEMVHAPTLYDRAFEAGLTTAQVDWVAIYNPGTITWSFAERPDPDGAIERELQARGIVTRDQVAQFNQGSSSAWRDQIWTDAAIHILREHKPNLLLFHLLALDSMHHRAGPGGPESYTTIAFQDAQLARVIQAVEDAGLRDRTTVLVVSDHGFRMAEKTVLPNVLFRERGLISGTGENRTAAAWTIGVGGTAMVYVTDPARREELVPKLASELAQVEGVAQVVTPDRFAELGLPTPDASNQAGDLLLVSKDGYDFASGDSGDLIVPVDATHRGHHGMLASDPKMDGIFVAWGAGVTPGTTLDAARTIDIGPTAAEWLGVSLGDVEGRSIADQLGSRATNSGN